MNERIDIFLVKKGLYETRQKAQDAITKGLVKVNSEIIQKPSKPVSENDLIEITEESVKYVSKGGLKLEKAFNDFEYNADQKIVLDIGASTGGFTDCCLQLGAQKVFAIDVGTKQLDKKLFNNPKIKSIENKNIKDLTFEEIENQKIDLIVADLSFTSITKVFDFFPKFLKENGDIIILIKPQFEAGKENIDKTGIVKNPNQHIKIIENISNYIQKSGFFIQQITNAPIYNIKKNIEYLALINRRTNKILPETIVKKSFELQKQLKL
jgi:23S rRNA (cytidine1920-2'-O)/16S rRNA (cytidine1409-2'-O)-methyltransferase